jgi:hypothetical protein
MPRWKLERGDRQLQGNLKIPEMTEKHVEKAIWTMLKHHQVSSKYNEGLVEDAHEMIMVALVNLIREIDEAGHRGDAMARAAVDEATVYIQEEGQEVT